MRCLITAFLLCSLFALRGQRTIHEVQTGGEVLKYALTLPDDFQRGKSYPVLLLPATTHEPFIYKGEGGASRGWILVESPINIKNSAFLPILVDRLESEISISSVYILGISANSSGAFSLAAQYDQLDGVIGVPGYPRSQSELKGLKTKRVLLVVGSRDRHWLAQSQATYEILTAMNASVRLEIIPGGGHILHDIAGDPFFELIEYLKN